MRRPVIAIVGRPNVGKSTLFNRLLGERRAIVEDIPGTTRDRLYAEITWGEFSLTLIDTGGLETSPETPLRQQVKEQVQLAIEDADVILFLVDAREGVMPDDLEIADLLRRSKKPVTLAVNKIDHPKQQSETLQFYELGLSEPLPISAYHGRGIDELLDSVIAHLSPPPSLPTEPEMIKLAIVGRPNVGKSMLLNAILGEERVIVDEAPGTTRDAVDTMLSYAGDRFLLIDSAGIRRRGRIEGGVERYSVLRALRAIERADVALLVTDATEFITDQDAHIASYILQAFKGMVLIVNKWDLIPEKDVAGWTREIRKKLKFIPYVPLLFLSARTGQGVKQVLPVAKKVYEERMKRIPTSLLNSLVRAAVASHSPPTKKGKQLKILYVTQAEVNPPTFVFFVNDARLVHFSYQRYLENRLRHVFGFEGTPLRFIFRGKGVGLP
jgi:GTP-binding protein